MCSLCVNIIGDELLLNFGAKFQRLYYYMRNFCNLIGFEQWYFNLIWNTYMRKLQTFCGFEITYNNFEISLVAFMPNMSNITTNHAITYTNL